uniref:Amino acid transporter transmembrane domain-containing protein n=1 Tax=Fagus sylvatica TaxID=28930 RepID=A0A2N9EH63_FAGSY
MELQRSSSFAVESGDTKFDDDGRKKRTGTLRSASAHIITAVIGSGVLSLAWALAQLGWIAGIVALCVFSLITLFTSSLLTNSYRSPTGTRNYNYMEAVKNNLGGIKYKICGVSQYSNLVGISIGYTITSAISMVAIKRSNCFHKNGHDAGCHTSNNPYMIIFGVIEIIISQIPNFHELAGLSFIAAVMSFSYALIGIGLSIGQIAEGKIGRTSISGTNVGVDVTSSEKAWNSLQAIGNIAFAYSYSNDTLKSSPPENLVMRKATTVGVSVTTIFYLLCGVLGYAAFGNHAPGNFLTGFGFYNPYWLVDIANICIVVHLVGAYQVFSQPVYQLVEDWCKSLWPESDFIVKEHQIVIPFVGIFNMNLFRLIWRTVFVIFTTVVAMIFPVFNSVLGLIGAAAFWPLTVYFPIEMHISKAKIPSFSLNWIWLKILNFACFIITIVAVAACIQGIITELNHYQPLKSIS